MFYAILGLVITLLDQATKKAVRHRIKPGRQIEAVPGKLYITNLKNSGAAYGLLANNPKLLHSLSAASIAWLAHTYSSIFKSGKGNAAYKLSCAMIMGGAAGNIIDRATRKYVTDFIYIPFAKRAPVFNLADFFVTAGTLVFFTANLFSQNGKKNRGVQSR